MNGEDEPGVLATIAGCRYRGMAANREQSSLVTRVTSMPAPGGHTPPLPARCRTCIEEEIGTLMTTQLSGPTVLVLLGVPALWST